MPVYRLEQGKRLLVGVSGFPGSGKSILATKLVSALNSAESTPIAICVGMDGWHYPRSTLSTFPDPKLAFDRRGSEWTFDSKRFADFVSSVKVQPTSAMKAPSFDHAKKDPLEDDIEILPSHRVVVFEGLYCNCSVGEWGRAAKEMDRRLVFEMDKEEAKRRLVVRHVATGVAKDEDEARWRGKSSLLVMTQLQLKDADAGFKLLDTVRQRTTTTFRTAIGSCRTFSNHTQL